VVSGRLEILVLMLTEKRGGSAAAGGRGDESSSSSGVGQRPNGLAFSLGGGSGVGFVG